MPCPSKYQVLTQMADANKRAAISGFACPSFQHELLCASQQSDWRRSVAALLGHLLPELRAALESGLFLAFCLSSPEEAFAACFRTGDLAAPILADLHAVCREPDSRAKGLPRTAPLQLDAGLILGTPTPLGLPLSRASGSSAGAARSCGGPCGSTHRPRLRDWHDPAR